MKLSPKVLEAVLANASDSPFSVYSNLLAPNAVDANVDSSSNNDNICFDNHPSNEPVLDPESSDTEQYIFVVAKFERLCRITRTNLDTDLFRLRAMFINDIKILNLNLQIECLENILTQVQQSTQFPDDKTAEHKQSNQDDTQGSLSSPSTE